MLLEHNLTSMNTVKMCKCRIVVVCMCSNSIVDRENIEESNNQPYLSHIINK